MIESPPSHDFTPEEINFLKQSIDHFETQANLSPQLDNGVVGGLFLMQLAFRLNSDKPNLSRVQQIATESNSRIYLLGVPVKDFVKEFKVNGNNVVIREVLFPTFDAKGQACKTPSVSNGHQYVMWGTVCPEKKAYYMDLFGLSEEQNLLNLKDTGMADVEEIVKTTEIN